MKLLVLIGSALLVLVLAVVGVIASQRDDDGSGRDPVDPSGGPEEVGRLLTTWSEADDRELGDPLRDLDIDPAGVVLRTDAERDAFLADLPNAVDATEVRDADLDDGLLVIGGYAKCAEVGRVMADDGEVWFETHTPEQFVCAWAPYTVEVWWVGYDELG